MTRARANGSARVGSTVRCAIYCRKSTTERLDSDFSSLDAQREACEAYIASQKHLHWKCLPERYDDGGVSGATLERPAMHRLMRDIDRGRIDCVVAHRIDRLSRSIRDFTGLMDKFDETGISFVSVTQNFDTSTSMGRLTRNILVSFSEFERELIAERTRDKVAAARRRGKWCGGVPPLGYDLDPRGGRLTVNESEAEIVRRVFDLYAEHESLGETVRALQTTGVETKRWKSRRGIEHGGGAWTKTRLASLLRNPVFIGKVAESGQLYDGEHEGIVDPELWERVQSLLRRNGRAGGRASRNKHGALLRGLLRCAACDSPMGHTYTTKDNRRFRYYRCLARQTSKASCPSRSLPAPEVEAFVVERIRSLGSDDAFQAEVLKHLRAQAAEGTGAQPHIDEDALRSTLQAFTPVWESLSPREQARVTELLISRIEFNGRAQTLAITFRPSAIDAVIEEGAA